MVIFPLEHNQENKIHSNGIQRPFKGLGSLDELFGMLRVDICVHVGRYFTELILRTDRIA